MTEYPSVWVGLVQILITGASCDEGVRVVKLQGKWPPSQIVVREGFDLNPSLVVIPIASSIFVACNGLAVNL